MTEKAQQSAAGQESVGVERPRRPTLATPANSSATSELLALHDDIGNQRVNALLQAGGSGSAPNTRRLVLGTPGDRYEQEADRVAGEIMSKAASESRQAVVARKAAERLHAPETPQRTLPIDANLSGRIEALQGQGEPLSAQQRAFFEPRFRRDFSQVRVHSGGGAVQVAKEVDADAFTIGRDIVFGAGQYPEESVARRRLLAHELTHVVQQEGGPPTTVMRQGRTARGFFANIFQFWDYSQETLDAYIRYLEGSNRIQGDYDSDDKARQIVAEWKEDKSSHTLSAHVRILMVREMLDGHVTDADEEGIIDLLEGSTNAELEEMFQTSPIRLTVTEIDAKFDTHNERLALFNERVVEKLGTYKAPDPEKARSLGSMLTDVEKEYGIVFNDFSLSFQVVPGTLQKSFKYDLVLPYPTTVTITLTPSQLAIDITPSLFVDVLWPFKNATVSRFILRFDGLQAKLEVAGSELASEEANKALRELIDGLLAGTRFADPKYNPVEDPHLVAEVMDQQVIGDLKRVQYNFEKTFSVEDEGKKGDSKLAESVSDPSIELNLTHKRGARLGDEKWAIKIDPGTKFNVRASAIARGSEMMKKNARLRQVSIRSDGIFVMRGKEPIVSLRAVHMNPGMKITLEGVRWLVDTKKLLREEAAESGSQFLKDAANKVADVAESVDEAVDTFNRIVTLGGLLGDPGKSDVLGDTAENLSEWLAGIVAEIILSTNREAIQSALGVSEEQINQFFGLTAPPEETKDDR